MKLVRHGFTLLEVIIGLVLMGSLAALALVSLSSHQHSIVLAKQKQFANQVAEALLTNWYDQKGDVPTRDQGVFGQNGEWMWRTQPIGTRSVCGLQVNIVRLEVMGKVGTRSEPSVLTSIELVQNQNASLLR